MEEMIPQYLEPKNRRERRRLISKKVSYELVRRLYPPKRLPINLGIREYKNAHRNESVRIAHYKKAMWDAYRELKTPSDDLPVTTN